MFLPKQPMERVKILIIAKILKVIINKSMTAIVTIYMRMRKQNIHLKIW